MCLAARAMWPSAVVRRSPARSRVSSNSVKPTIADSGVRSSWLMVDRKSDFARLAVSAAACASSASRRALRSACAALRAVRSRMFVLMCRGTPCRLRTTDAVMTTETIVPSARR